MKEDYFGFVIDNDAPKIVKMSETKRLKTIILIFVLIGMICSAKADIQPLQEDLCSLLGSYIYKSDYISPYMYELCENFDCVIPTRNSKYVHRKAHDGYIIPQCYKFIEYEDSVYGPGEIVWTSDEFLSLAQTKIHIGMTVEEFRELYDGDLLPFELYDDIPAYGDFPAFDKLFLGAYVNSGIKDGSTIETYRYSIDISGEEYAITAVFDLCFSNDVLALIKCNTEVMQ